MKYVSTRGAAPVLEFGDVLLAGLARDGGLYVPETWPTLAADALAPLRARCRYAEVAVEVMWPFVEGGIDRDDFAALVADAYATFDDPDVVPLRDLGDGMWLAELFHGPTLAFKDVALQLVGRLFDHELDPPGRAGHHRRRHLGRHRLGGHRGLPRPRRASTIVILHPAGRVSRGAAPADDHGRRAQRAQPRRRGHLRRLPGPGEGAVRRRAVPRPGATCRRSTRINWARVMAQIVYYVTSRGPARPAARRPVAFSVPTGNFGNVFAGYGAQRMGLPVAQFVVGSNRNDILTRFLDDRRRWRSARSQPTLSPSMDIQVSSNLERLLFELYGRDGAAVAELMAARSGPRAGVALDADRMGLLAEHWSAAGSTTTAPPRSSPSSTSATGVLVDPHTAVGLGAAARVPARSVGADGGAGHRPPGQVPRRGRGGHRRAAAAARPRLADLFDRPERYDDGRQRLTTWSAARIESYARRRRPTRRAAGFLA